MSHRDNVQVDPEITLEGEVESAAQVSAMGRKAGRGVSWALSGAMRAAALIPALIAGMHLDGIRGAAIAHAIVAVMVAIPLGVVVLQRGGLNLRPDAPALVRPLLGGLVAGLVMLGLSKLLEFPPPAELFAVGGAGLITYVLGVFPASQFPVFLTRARHLHHRRQAAA
jgi:hypothetical protein